MLQIKFLRLFTQRDTNQSLQRLVSNDENKNPQHIRTYEEIVQIADKIKYKRTLTFRERLIAARYYRSLINELNGRTVRYNSYRKNE